MQIRKLIRMQLHPQSMFSRGLEYARDLFR